MVQATKSAKKLLAPRNGNSNETKCVASHDNYPLTSLNPLNALLQIAYVEYATQSDALESTCKVYFLLLKGEHLMIQQR